MNVTKDTIIGELVEAHPEVIEVLSGFGVQCFGCQGAVFESIGDGFSQHGISNELIEEAVKKINEEINKHQEKPPENIENPSFDITELAAKKIEQFMSDKNKTALRVSVKTGGCSGMQYEFSLIESKNEGDFEFTINRARVLVDKKSMEHLNNCQLDYLDSLSEAGFKIANPNAKETCGCGKSFS